MANIFRVYKDSQVTADRIRAENAAARLDNAPERRLYVFGGADGTFPYFASFGSALTYANALTPAPSTTHPVSIVLLSKQNGDPEVISGNDDWYALCLDGIYVSSPYREIFSTTTLPTTLPKGMRVLYRSGGIETLYVGNDSNVAQAISGGGTEIDTEQVAQIYANFALANETIKVVRDSAGRGYLFQGNANGLAKPLAGYGEFMARVSQSGTSNPTTRVFVNTAGVATQFIRASQGVYTMPLFSSGVSEVAITANDIFFPGQNQGFVIYETGSAITTPLGFYRLEVGTTGGSPRVELKVYDSANDGSADLSDIIGTGSIDIHFIYINSATI